MRGNMPVALVVSRPSTDEAYWIPVKSYFGDPARRVTRKVNFNKELHRFDSGAYKYLRELAGHDYRGAERIQMLRAVAPPITPGDLREACTIGLAVPIAGEMPLPTLHRLREVSRVLIADAQGFVRAWDQAG